MSTLITIIHVVASLVLIIAVLLQSGKAADLAGAFGGAGSQSTFGPRGGQTLLTKVTTACAVIFMLTSLGLWILSSSRTSKSVLSGEKAEVTETAEEKGQKSAQTEKTAEKQQKKEEKKETTDPEKK